MKQKKLISLVLGLTIIMCGNNSTSSETIEEVNDLETKKTEEGTQENTQPDQAQSEQSQNTNPFFLSSFRSL